MITASSDVTVIARTFWGGWLGTAREKENEGRSHKRKGSSGKIIQAPMEAQYNR